MIRLDKYLSDATGLTRSEAGRAIRSGTVTVNGSVVRKPEQKFDENTVSVTLNGSPCRYSRFRYYLLDKPTGLITASRDSRQETVLDLFPPEIRKLNIAPVGRLDKDTEGLLLLTTDGTLAHQILSPRRQVWKTYRAVVDGPLSGEDVLAFERGLALSDFTALPARLTILRSSGTEAEALVDVCEGKYHQVRRMFEARGRIVTALKRLAIGPISLDESLAVGEYRELTEAELRAIRQAVSGEKYAE